MSCRDVLSNTVTAKEGEKMSDYHKWLAKQVNYLIRMGMKEIDPGMFEAWEKMWKKRNER